MNSGDTAFMLVATAMVMLMTPGLALFLRGIGQVEKRVVGQQFPKGTETTQ